MITDWLRDPSVSVLAYPIAALLCAVVLAATRRALPPEQPKWRLRRAVFVAAMMAAIPAVQCGMIGPQFHGVFAFMPHEPREPLRLAMFVLGAGVMFGWLIPCLIEGRTLAEMGWTRKKAGRYVVVGLLVGAVLGATIYNRLAVPDIPGVFPEERGLAALALVPWQFVLGCAILGLTIGWVEENVFRGHLMPCAVERGEDAGRANALQSLVFAAYHLPAAAMMLQRSSTPVPPAAALVMRAASLILWGLLFGWMRKRTGSIVLPAVTHATLDAVYYLVSWAPMAAMMGGIGGIVHGR